MKLKELHLNLILSQIPYYNINFFNITNVKEIKQDYKGFKGKPNRPRKDQEFLQAIFEAILLGHVRWLFHRS